MAIEPVAEIINREIGDPELQNVLGDLSRGLEELVNFGSRILTRFIEETKPTLENIVIGLSLRHELDLLDSVSILIGKGCADPCRPLLRVMLESYLGLEFIMAKDTGKRARAFLVAHLHDELEKLERMDISTERGKRFSDVLERDRFLGGYVPPGGVTKWREKIEEIKKLLAQRDFVEVDAEYRSVWQKTKKTPGGILYLVGLRACGRSRKS